MPTVFFTGFPGFLGSELLPRVLSRSPEHEAVCLVQPKFMALARQRTDAIATRHGLAGRIRLEPGDITRPDLGLADFRGLQRATSEIFHLAAIYDLSVSREVAMRVNVEGTRHILAFAEGATGLRRFQYVSTCYVSGRHRGTFSEDDLDVGQRFNNHYEETKFLAEVAVQRTMHGGLPTTVYRPAIVVGDSATGETQKYDGPYFVIQWLARQPRVALIPIVGDPRAARVNVVPRDYLVDAVAWLSARDLSADRVYQLADPHPLTVDEMLKVLSRAMHRRLLRIPVPLSVAKLAIDHAPGMYRLMRIPSSALDYFVHPTVYTADHVRADLEGSGIQLPRFESYVAPLVDFVERHPEIGSAAMA